MTVAACDEACAGTSGCVLFRLSETAAFAGSSAKYDTCTLYSVSTTFCETWVTFTGPPVSRPDRYYTPSNAWCDGTSDPGFKVSYDTVLKLSPGTAPGPTLDLWAAFGSTYKKMSLEYSRVTQYGVLAENSYTNVNDCAGAFASNTKGYTGFAWCRSGNCITRANAYGRCIFYQKEFRSLRFSTFYSGEFGDFDYQKDMNIMTTINESGQKQCNMPYPRGSSSSDANCAVGTVTADSTKKYFSVMAATAPPDG